MRNRPDHRQPPPAAGFTMMEIVVVLAVISMLAGTLVPMLTASQRAEAIVNATSELEALADALHRYYYDRGRFPNTVNATGFLGTYAAPGVSEARVRDEWGTKTYYRLEFASSPDLAICYSVGTDGVTSGAASETLKVTVHGADAGGRRTRERMRVVGAALARHLDAGGRVTGDWTIDRPALGLGTEYATDGFGTPFALDAATLALRSAGADRQFSTADDLAL